MRFFRKNASLAPRRSGFDSRRLHSHASVVSTASTRPLYGRGAGSTPAGGSFRTPVAQRNERCPATAEDAGSIPAGRIHADVAHPEEHRVASPERPVRDGSSALEDSWCNGSTPSSNLGGPGSIPGESAARPRRGPERVGYLMERRAQALAVRRRGPDRTPRPRHSKAAAGPDGFRLSTNASTGRGFESRPEPERAPVAQLVEQFRASTTTAAARSTWSSRWTRLPSGRTRGTRSTRSSPRSSASAPG